MGLFKLELKLKFKHIPDSQNREGARSPEAPTWDMSGGWKGGGASENPYLRQTEMSDMGGCGTKT